jgi:hydrogenase expression/formation protein HypC
MCVAVPLKIEQKRGSRGVVALGGSRVEAQLDLVPQAQVGDWVLVHAGIAIATITDADAQATFDVLREMDQAMGASGETPGDTHG